MFAGLGNLLDSFRKLTPVPLLAIGIGTTALLFVPENVAEKTGANEFRESFQGYLGVAFYIAWSFLLAYLICSLKNPAITAWKSYCLHRERKKLLSSLAPHERGYLAVFIREGQTTFNCKAEDGVIGGLGYKGIVYPSTSIGSISKGYPWNLHPWAYRYLKKHPELLDGGLPPPRPDADGCLYDI